MKPSVDAVTTTAPTQLTESETDHVAGGAPKNDPGNAWGAGIGAGFAGHGQSKGQGADNNNEDHGRF